MNRLWQVYADGSKVGDYLTYEGAFATFNILVDKRRMVTQNGKTFYEKRYRTVWLKSILGTPEKKGQKS